MAKVELRLAECSLDESSHFMVGDRGKRDCAALAFLPRSQPQFIGSPLTQISCDSDENIAEI